MRAQNYVIPCRSKIGMTMRASSLALYSLFSSGGRGTRPVSMQGRVNALGMLPLGIERKGLAGAVTFTDAVCDDAGLALALLGRWSTARWRSTECACMIDAEADGRRHFGCAQDSENGRKRKVRVRTVFNCAGVWADDVRRMVDVTCGNNVKIVRRSYIVVDKTFLCLRAMPFTSPRGCGRGPLTIVPVAGASF